MSKTEIEWNINPNITRYFKQASTGQVFYSPDIDYIWCLSCHPSGIDTQSEGQLILGLELIRLPPKIRAIEINLGLKAVQNNINAVYKPKKTMTFHYKQKNRKLRWPARMKLFPHDLLQFMDKLQFIVNIQIINIHACGSITSSKKGGKKIKKTQWKDYKIESNINTNVIKINDIDLGGSNMNGNGNVTASTTTPCVKTSLSSSSSSFIPKPSTEPACFFICLFITV